MNWLRLAWMALANLGHHKLRSALTMLGMVFGVGAVVAMLAISEGARMQALENIRGMGLDNVLLKSRQPSSAANANAGKNDTEILRYGLTFTDRALLGQVLPDLVGTVSLREERKKVWKDDRRIEARVISTEPVFGAAAGLRIARGRWLCDLDQAAKLSVAVVGNEVARELIRLDDALGSEIKINNHTWRVVGVLAPARASGSAGGLSGDEVDRAIFLPDATALERYGTMNVQSESGSWQATRIELTQLTLRFRPGSEVARRGELVRRILNRDKPRADVEVVVPVELLENQRRTQRIFAVVMASIASISLLVGGIGIMNIMLATILERTREIGIRRAVGARRSDILAQFLVETVVLCLVGGGIGLGLGLGGAWLVSAVAGMPAVVTAWSIILAIGICLLVGVVFGLYPAIKAARMQPVEALRHA